MMAKAVKHRTDNALTMPALESSKLVAIASAVSEGDMLRELCPASGETRATFMVRPRERATLKVDVTVAPWKPEDTSLWLWFLEPAPLDVAGSRNRASTKVFPSAAIDVPGGAAID